MKTTKAGRWVLLGFNLVLATAILAQPGRAASTGGGNDCFMQCFRGWAGCVLEGASDCSYELSECWDGCMSDIWSPPSIPKPF